MANEKITELPQAVTAGLSDIIYAVQGYVSPSAPGTSVQQTLQQVFTLFDSSFVLNYAGNPNGNLAGTVYQLCWDTTNSIMYVCTTSGIVSTAIWTQVSASASGITNPAHGGTGVASPTAHTLPVAEGSSNFNFLGPLTNGQLLIGSTGADPVAAAITGSAGITVSLGAGTINISGGGGGYSWTEVTGTTQAMSTNNGYIANNAGLVTLTLPATAAVGNTVSVQGKGAGLFRIAQNAGQTIHFGSSDTTAGAGGSLSATNRYNSVELLCITTNTDWAVLTGVQGILTIV